MAAIAAIAGPAYPRAMIPRASLPAPVRRASDGREPVRLAFVSLAFVSLALVGLAVLAGCANGPFARMGVGPSATPPADAAAPAGPPPPAAGANTAEALDTTTEADRQAALAAPGNDSDLGTTIASLGNPALPGFWLETPLVTKVTPGAVTAANGRRVAVELRPIPGPVTAGSRISLAALRLLDLPLTGLATLTVSAG